MARKRKTLQHHEDHDSDDHVVPVLKKSRTEESEHGDSSTFAEDTEDDRTVSASTESTLRLTRQLDDATRGNSVYDGDLNKPCFSQAGAEEVGAYDPEGRPQAVQKRKWKALNSIYDASGGDIGQLLDYRLQPKLLALGNICKLEPINWTVVRLEAYAKVCFYVKPTKLNELLLAVVQRRLERQNTEEGACGYEILQVVDKLKADGVQPMTKKEAKAQWKTVK